MEIVWTESALQRLEEIGCFISTDSPARAIAFIDSLITSVERLRNFPLSGSLVFANPAFRHVVVQGYSIIYRVQEKKIEIITVISSGLQEKI